MLFAENPGLGEAAAIGRANTNAHQATENARQAAYNADTARRWEEACMGWKKRALTAEEQLLIKMAHADGLAAQKDFLLEAITSHEAKAKEYAFTPSGEISMKNGKPISLIGQAYVKAFDAYLAQTDIPRPYSRYRNF